MNQWEVYELCKRTGQTYREFRSLDIDSKIHFLYDMHNLIPGENLVNGVTEYHYSSWANGNENVLIQQEKVDKPVNNTEKGVGKMDQLKIIEHIDQRVLTTSQIADAFGTDPKRISENFNRNQDRYILGKHYFALEGDEKRKFLNNTQIADGSKNASVLYIWTEKGAWMHAKSLNTDEAWTAYEKLVDDYYRVQLQLPNPMIKDQALVTMLRTTADLVEKQHEISMILQDHSQQIQEVKSIAIERITIDSKEQRILQKAISRRVYALVNDQDRRKELFRELHTEIRDRWGVASYRDVRRTALNHVLNYIDAWYPKVA